MPGDLEQLAPAEIVALLEYAEAKVKALTAKPKPKGIGHP
jgi:hypothetical protein